jgi:serine protease Do
MKACAAGLLLCPLLLVPASNRAAEPTQREFLDAIERQLTAAREKAGPAVACVVISRSDRYPKPSDPPRPGILGSFDPAEYRQAHPEQTDLARRLNLRDPASIPDHSYAGGVVIDPAGLVLVTYHSIEGATKIFVHLTGGQGSYADIHAADARSDLAVLKLLTPPADLKAISLGEAQLQNRTGGRQANVRPGKLIVLMANSYTATFKADRPSAALGSISNIWRRPGVRERDAAKAEPRYRSIYNYSPILEYETKLGLASSGAAVLNLDGEMIGISTITASVGNGENGVGQALPFARNLRRIIDVLRRGEEVDYGFLGVVLDEQLPGISLGRITARSPAADANLLPGDRIVAIDGFPTSTYEDLLLHLGSALAGTKLQLVVERAGQPREVAVTLAKFKNDAPYIASVRPEPVFGLRVDYGSVLAQTLSDFGRRGSGVPHGVMVRDLEPDSPAAARFKSLGDNNRWVVTQVNGVATRTPPDFYKTARGQQSLKLTVLDAADPTAKPRELTLP